MNVVHEVLKCFVWPSVWSSSLKAFFLKFLTASVSYTYCVAATELLDLLDLFISENFFFFERAKLIFVYCNYY